LSPYVNVRANVVPGGFGATRTVFASTASAAR
jgi:hypothetical protein